jgi:hypothetical protein
MISRLTNQVNSNTQKNLSKGAPSSARHKKTGKPKGKSNDPKADAATTGANRNQPKNGKNKEDAEALEIEDDCLILLLRVQKAIMHTYGFVSDPSLTSGHKLAIQLSRTRSYLISSGHKNLCLPQPLYHPIASKKLPILPRTRTKLLSNAITYYWAKTIRKNLKPISKTHPHQVAFRQF